MDRHDRIRGVVFAAEHLLGFGGVDLLFQRVERFLEVGGDVFATLRPLEEDADVVDLLGEAVAEFQIVAEAALTLQRLLRFGLVVPEIGSGDFLFELR